MKVLLKTLYISTEHINLSLENSNIVLMHDKKLVAKLPLNNFEKIIIIECANATIPLLVYCSEHKIQISFLSRNGTFQFMVEPPLSGNVLLREKQHIAHSNQNACLDYSRAFIAGKILNQIRLIKDYKKNHALSLDVEKLNNVVTKLKKAILSLQNGNSIEELMGIEGISSAIYFDTFDDLIFQQREFFYFNGRNRRPPTDPVNALLSFMYSILTNRVSGSLKSVGLDSQMGFLHQNRPGRDSLACDLVEELRPVLVDRFVLRLINKNLIKPTDFEIKETVEVKMKDSAFKVIFLQWDKFMQEEIRHDFLEETVKQGLLPYVQSLLLSKAIRGELDSYPPYVR